MTYTIGDIAQKIGLTPSTPVSYTHLDVYKRQGNSSVLSLSGHKGNSRFAYGLDIPVDRPPGYFKLLCQIGG